MNIYLIGTLDTKGRELGFIRDLLRSWGFSCVVVDAGSSGQPAIEADIKREQVFGQLPMEFPSRGEAVQQAALGVTSIVRQAYDRNELAGILALGGSAGTTIGTQAMRSLPIGVPKVMVSTLASGNVRGFVGDKDICMINSVVDILGINRISRAVLSEAAAALAGIVHFRPGTSSTEDKPLVAATMFGVTTPCVERARDVIEQAGYEVLVFHATGSGGQAMESLIQDGLIAGVLDITTTELADELVGGVLSAGKDRLTAAGRIGIPQVISVGALDMVNFGPRETVPNRFSERQFHVHNANVTLMRTTKEECKILGEEIGRKALASRGPVTILFPRSGISALDAPQKPFDAPESREALLTGIEETREQVPIKVLDSHINDPTFAEAAAHTLLEMLQASKRR